MSLEAALAENTATMKALIEKLTETNSIKERLLAVSQTAVDKVEAPKATRSRKTKDEPAPESKPAAEEPAATESGADDAGSASDTVDHEAEAKALADHGRTLLGAAKEKGADDYKKLGVFLTQTMPPEFGGQKLGELLDADDRKRARFYMDRFAAGQAVDFSADYDFDSDPTAAGEDDFGDI